MGELLVVGDRILIQPSDGEEQTSGGLVLPETVALQDNVRSGYVVKTGPGYLMPNPEYTEDDSWKPDGSMVRYLPLQAEPGDYAFFLRDKAIELRYNDQEYLIVSHGAVLALVRNPEEEPSDTTLDDLDDLWADE
ncbi:co-chaperone GroES [Salisaeta longa]|uniref:co-chaperone GroES n=1 Tax=Salisaeta longa TaxID=503170 RepID=UPI0003B49D86|nr:co-chaperone GroES family protein [Salisaeta longa]